MPLGRFYMPREARVKSESGMYHVLLRGINKQVIFEDDTDKKQFINTLIRYKAKNAFALYAYCLMSNHVHLLIEEKEEELASIMRRIGTSYVYWYNLNHKRVGPLFQDRYKSENVEDEHYFLKVLRYIHQNPVKARMVNEINEYQWCSYNDYLHVKGITDIKYAISFFSDSNENDIDTFIEYHKENDNMEYLDNRYTIRYKDEDAISLLKQIVGINSCIEFINLDKNDKVKNIKELLGEGVSLRQIARITGISRSKIMKISQ
jgi:putative transposase